MESDETTSREAMQVTPEMIESGKRALWLCDLEDPTPEGRTELVTRIFTAMRRSQLTQCVFEFSS